MKTFLLALFVVNVLLIIILVLRKRDNVCLTEKCALAASRVITAMDRTVDPCEDFYEFACGKWIKKNPVPYWTSNWDRMSALKDSLVQDMLQLLRPEKQLANEPSAVGKARDFYQTCTNDTGTSVRRLGAALAALGLPSRPLSATTLDWLYVIANIRRSLGFHLLFALAVNVHVRNSSAHQLTLSPATNGFPLKLLQEPEKYGEALEYYESFITSSLRAFFPGESVGEDFAEDVVGMSVELARAVTRTGGPGRNLHEFNLHQLAARRGFDGTTRDTINWTRYFEIVFEKPDALLNPDELKVLVYDVPYLERLGEILQNANETVLVRYLWWNTFAKFPPINAQMEKLFTQFAEKVYRIRRPKLRACSHNLVSNFGWMPPSTVNAYYSYDQNVVNVPFAILDAPFFDNGVDAVDYGAVGSIMGHEIAHGFDDWGRKFDPEGQRADDWLAEGRALKNYRRRVDCLIAQYGRYWTRELGERFKVNGTRTKEENVADNAGIRASFEAYKRQAEEITLPGLANLKGDQLFFLGYAQSWCGSYTVEGLKSRLSDGRHSPNRIRVLGTLANFAEFARSWNCPAGSAMNPINKCVLW